ncbi:MAG: hypothetical protein C0594_16355 [Marinilabiliales bacterium]|nr:MAG: hypothetical protein C0594_16355 [Marinilabiliales bacterium]
MKIKYFLISFLCIASSVYAQQGNTCQYPYLIDTFPFQGMGFSTENSGNNYNSDDACNSSYLTGNDFVFEYQADVSRNITIKLQNTMSGAGVFMLDGCPDNSATNCVASAESGFDGNPVIENVAVAAGQTYYIVVSTWDLMGAFPYTTFDIYMEEVFDKDAVAFFIWSPKSSCNPDSLIRLEVKNYGLDTIFGFDVGYSINGEPTVYRHSDDTLAFSDWLDYTFWGSVYDFSTIGEYNIEAFVHINGDENPNNDTTYRTIHTMPSMSTFPFFDDFETQENWSANWKWPDNPEMSWEQSIPSGTIINSAASGQQCWVTNADGNVGMNEDSYLISPCFDFSTLVLPVVEFKLWYEIPDYARLVMQYSTNYGYGWTDLGETGEGENWYNTPLNSSIPAGWTENSAGWQLCRLQLDTFGGVDNIMFRFRYEGNLETNEGAAIDDFSIYESPANDLGVSEIKYPANSCGLTDQSEVAIEVKNYGSEPQYEWQIAYRTGNGDWNYTDISDTINPAESKLYYCDQTADFSLAGEYTVYAKTVLPDDLHTTNDSLAKIFYHFPNIYDFPYLEDFETDNGGWYAVGDTSSWEYGVLSDTVMTYAASGTHCWATNLSGYHENLEASTLYSPCFDFTSIVNPVLNMKIWFETEYPSYIQLYASTDGGTSWSLVDIDQDSCWYNSGHSWNGDSQEWIEVHNKLNGLEGYEQVQFRVEFNGGVPLSGCALDDIFICDEPQAGFTYVQDGLDVTFTDTSLNSTHVNWIFGDGSASSLQSPQYHYTDNDSLYVTQIASNECYSSSDSVFIIVNSTFDFIGKDILVYPNPVNEVLVIETENFSGTAELLDITGRILNCIKLEKNSKSIVDMSELQSGLYFLRYRSEQMEFIQKIIKKH